MSAQRTQDERPEKGQNCGLAWNRKTRLEESNSKRKGKASAKTAFKEA